MSVATSELVDHAIDISREAGRLLMDELPLGRWREGVEHKGGRELVSRVDRASEQLIVKRIGQAYPDHAIFAEEGSGSDAAGAGYRWIIDPLDGTANFLHGHPIFAVSIAVERLGEPSETVAGVVYLPYLDEMFFAERGVGSFLNSRSIRLEVSATGELDDAVVATGFAYDRERFDNYDNFQRLVRAARGLRRCGSAATDLAYVAAGRYDAFWELGLRAWDVAAGALLVREAGGRVADFAGGDDWLSGRNVIACNGQLFEQVQELLDPVKGESTS